MRRRNGSAFTWILLGLLVVTLVYLMVDVGSAGDVFTQYESVKGSKSSSFSRRVIFLNSYIDATGDLSIANSVGLSADEMQQIHNSYDRYNTSGGSGGGLASGKTKSEWEKALISCGNPAYYSIGAGYKLVEHNGSQFLVEVQGAGYYSNIKNGSSDSVDSVGCWLFAQVNAANALNNTTFSVRDVFQQRHNVSVDWNTNTNKWVNPSSNNRGQLNVGQRVVSEEASVNNLLGVNMTQISSGGITAESCYNKISEDIKRSGSAGWDGTVYIVYGHAPGVLSNGDNHWLVVVGLTDDGFQLLGNGKRGDTIPISKIGSKAGAFTTVLRVERSK